MIQKKILIISNSFDTHVSYVIPHIKACGGIPIVLRTDKLGVEDYVVCSHNQNDNYLFIQNKKVLLRDIHAVWFRKPTYHKKLNNLIDLSTQLTIRNNKEMISWLYSILSQCKWISHPHQIDIAENKLLQMYIAKKVGLNIPPTIVSNDPEAVRSFFDQHNNYCMVKPLASNASIGTYSGCIPNKLLKRMHANQLSHVNDLPILIQPYIAKLFELRITIIGNTVFSVKLDSQKNKESQHNWKNLSSDKLPHSIYKLPPEIEKSLRLFMKEFDLLFSTFDMIVAPNHSYYFLENNPNGQFLWMQIFLPKLKMAQTLAKVLVS